MRTFANKNYWSKNDIREHFGRKGWNMGDRTIDFYVREGLLRSPHRLPEGKEVYWEKRYVKPALELVMRLKMKGWKLAAIRDFITRRDEDGNN